MDFILSFPYVRIIFTRQAKPSLASHAPSDKISKGGKASVFGSDDNVSDANINNPNVIASRLSKHNRKVL